MMISFNLKNVKKNINKIEYKNTILVFLLLPIFIYSQNNIQLTPEFSISNPLGAYSQETIDAQQGFGGGLHIDKLNIWKVLGLGAYAGYNQNATEFTTGFPNDINEGAFNAQLNVDANQLNWQSFQLGLGPILDLNLSKQFSFQAYSKAGFAKVGYPDYRYYVDVSQRSQQEYTLFEANTPENLQSNFNFMLLSGARLNYMFNERIGIGIGFSYLHIKGVTHSYSKLDANFTPDMDLALLLEALNSSETITKTYECNFNSINGTIGITISIGGDPNPDEPDDPDDPEEVEPDIPIDPYEPQEDYNCKGVVYEAPGYNDAVILSQTPYVVFQWTDNNIRALKEDKEYQLIFYIKENGAYQQVDKNIMSSKRRFRIGLNPNKAYPDNVLYWQIVPVDANEKEFCPEQSKLMRLLVFKNKEEANEKLPECLLVNEEDENKKQKSTDAFRKNKYNEKN